MVHIHDGILLNYERNPLDSVLMRWMYLEPIIQSEVSQKEKDKCRILTHIYKNLERLLMILPAGQQRRQDHKKQTFRHSGRRGWDDLREQH